MEIFGLGRRGGISYGLIHNTVDNINTITRIHNKLINTKHMTSPVTLQGDVLLTTDEIQPHDPNSEEQQRPRSKPRRRDYMYTDGGTNAPRVDPSHA